MSQDSIAYSDACGNPKLVRASCFQLCHLMYHIQACVFLYNVTHKNFKFYYGFCHVILTY